MTDPSVFVSAGDHSGDIASAPMVTALKNALPGLKLMGLGGERLQALGQEQPVPGRELAVLGFWEVVRRYPFFRSLMKTCVDWIETRRPDCIILVDYPGFNLRLARRIKHLGIPIVYYITPQVWAWGTGRVKQIRELIDTVLVILPFEVDFFRPYGIDANFVGHYLLDDIPSRMITSELPSEKRLALLPGSRPQEIDRMLPLMIEVARRMNSEHGFESTIAGVRGACDYDAVVRRYAGEPIHVDYDDSRQVVHDAQLVVTASGTATLETGIIGRPMVVVYKTGMITYAIARWLVELDSIALVNLVMGEKVVPELIQGRATPAAVVARLNRFIDDASVMKDVLGKLQGVPRILGGKGSSQRAADAVLKAMEDR